MGRCADGYGSRSASYAGYNKMIQFDDRSLEDADTLVVAFTGIHHGLGQIPFEFYRSLRGTCALFVSDRSQRWYQNGVAEIVERIGTATKETGSKKLVLIGNSMGGFAALLFGSLCDADHILAFAPQTTIIPEQTDALGDARWQQYQREMDNIPFGDVAVLPAPASTHIIYGEESVLDKAHAIRLGWPCQITPVAGADHGPAAVLRAKGELIPLLQQIVT